MKRYRVRLADDAEWDLIDICRYVASRDSAERAAHLLNRLESLCLSLVELPECGQVPSELDRIGVSVYREVLLEAYRVIYEISGQDVYVHCIIDGRRDIQSLLQRRVVR